jgi:hypothetical protein
MLQLALASWRLPVNISSKLVAITITNSQIIRNNSKLTKQQQQISDYGPPLCVSSGTFLETETVFCFLAGPCPAFLTTIVATVFVAAKIAVASPFVVELALQLLVARRQHRSHPCSPSFFFVMAAPSGYVFKTKLLNKKNTQWVRI